MAKRRRKKAKKAKKAKRRRRRSTKTAKRGGGRRRKTTKRHTKRKTRTYRTSRMSKAQADPIQPGDKYRLGMYVATSTRKGAISDLRDWQREEMGGLEVKYTWVFTIPKGCRQAT